MDAHARKAIGFLLWHLAAGVGGAAVLGGLVLWFDIGRLRTLIWSTGEPALALGLFLFGLFVTFGGCAMAAGVMAQGRQDRR
ncbi:MAG: hypothetical protein JNM30_12585 [Rhodospirillales bacterium]|nr:hypothetical protein [Rhodospirillales bacterium]